MSHQYFISREGRDTWSGRLPEPNRAKTDGPFATLERAKREAGKSPQPVSFLVREGIYSPAQPLVFKPGNSLRYNPADYPHGKFPGRRITFSAFQNEHVVISGGRKITGWRETTLQGRQAWSVFLPDVKKGTWNFTQLWVNGRSAARPRLPKKGYYRIAEVPATLQNHVLFRDGDLRPWKNLHDVEFVALHFWIESRIPFEKIDETTHTAHLAFKPRLPLTEGNRGASYYVDNVFEALDEPGQWYLDRPAGMLYYLPRTGEKITTVDIVAPRLGQLLLFEGNPLRNQWVEGIDFDGLTFAHTEWTPGGEARTATPQAACHVPGAVSFKHARHCSLSRCRIEHAGSYGIELLDGCSDIVLRNNTIRDLAAGGIKIWHDCRRTIVEDNVIADGGHRFHSAVGVLIGKSSGNIISHNHIHDFDYTGISVGWTWGYEESSAYGNIIEYNHIHHIGRGMLSDLGGVYTLGVSPGTRICCNVFHDIHARSYGGNGLYTDEGSTDILLENNLVYRVDTGYHLNYGRENLVRNNIFAFAGKHVMSRGGAEHHCSFHFTNNIIYGDAPAVVTGDWSEGWAEVDRNLYFCKGKKKPLFNATSFRAWQAGGHDLHSKIADPLFADPHAGDFSLSRRSPALSLGFVPFDLSSVGPRPAASIPRRPPEATTGFQKKWKVSRAIPFNGANPSDLAYPRNLSRLGLKTRLFPDRFCNVHADLFAGAPDNVLAWFFCEFQCEEPMRLIIYGGYDGPVKIWINGRERFRDPHGTNPGTEKAVLPFKASKGHHTILVALSSNNGRAWGLSLRMIRTDVGKRDLKTGSFLLPVFVK